jgi:short-subunit dehydrogenase
MAAFLHEPGLRILELDVNKPAQIQRAVRRIEKESGPLGVLVNNAGYGLYGAFEELPEKEFRAQLETNFFGAMRMVRAVLPGMRSAGRGRILNISSILGRLALPTGSAYTSSKWALEAFSESLRYELLPLGIYTSLIEPGLIRTNFKANMQIAKPAHAKRRSPYGFLTEKIQRDYDGFATSAAAAARHIASIVERRRPAVRYRVGLDSHAYNFLRRALPERVFDWLLRLVVHTAYRRSNK